MKSLYSCSALSLAYPYFCCKSPRSFSSFPSTWVRSSSVSLPHFSLTPPLISFHLPFRTSSFLFVLLFFPSGLRTFNTWDQGKERMVRRRPLLPICRSSPIPGHRH